MNRFTPSNYFLPHVSFEVYINRDVLLGFNVFPSDVLRTLLLLSLDKELHEITFFFLSGLTGSLFVSLPCCIKPTGGKP